MNRSRVKSPEILNMGRFSPQSQSPRPFSPNEGAHPSPKAPLSKFSITAKQPRIISSARHASRNLSLIPTPTLQQPSQTSKVNMKIALFDHLPGLKKVSSQSTRSSYAAPFSDRNENTDSEQLPSPGKQVHTDNPIDNSSPILTKSIFNKLHHEKSERKVSFRESDTEDMTVSSVFSTMEQKPKVGKVRVSTRFAVLNKVVAQSQKGKTGVLKNSPGGNDTLEADSVVSVHLSPEKKEVEPIPRKGLNFGLGNPESLMKPVQRKRESFSANPSNRKQPGEAQQKTEEERRSSRIMTKELEMKFGIQLDESEGTSSESEEGQTDIKRSPKRDKKLDENGQQQGEGSPKKKRFSAVREFILRKHAMESLKVEAKREELEKQQAELFVKNYPESARDRPRTQGPLSGIFDNERRFSERPIAFTGKPEGEKVFVNGTNNFFQLNPESRTYKEFKGIFDEDLKAFGNPGSPEKKEEEKEGNDEYKPMIVYFSAGSKILQPKYMTKMGSMCCTELWPKKLSMYMQKHLVQAKDCVRLADTGRNHEMVYRPKKWQKEEHIQKNISKNIQSRRNGHDALMVKSAVPSSRKTRSVQAQKAGFEV